MTSKKVGDIGEKRVLHWLLGRGFVVRKAPAHAPFDLLIRQLRIEVKCAAYNGRRWKFNIHRHNKLNEKQVDYYILRLEKFPQSSKALYLVMKAPLKRMTIDVTIRSLLEKYHPFVNATSQLS